MKNPLTLLLPQLPQRQKELVEWAQLHGCAGSLAIANASKLHSGIIVVITSDILSASQIEYEIRFFLQEKQPGKVAAIPILNFPDRETLPYDTFLPHPDIISERLRVLNRLSNLKQGVLIISISTLMHRLMPRDYLNKSSLLLQVGQSLNLTDFRRELEKNGYLNVSQVVEHGEFAVRGSIVDLYPMGSRKAFRIDLFDDEIESIRTFDPETQLSIERINEITLLPAHEIPLDEASVSFFRQRFREQFEHCYMECSVYQDVSDRHYTPGVEYFLPLFFQETANLFDYLPENSLICRINNISERSEQFWQETQIRYDQLKDDMTCPVLPPEMVFLSPEEMFSKIKSFSQICIHEEPITKGTGGLNFRTEPLPRLGIDHQSKKPLHLLQDFLKKQESRILFCAETMGRKESLLNWFDTIDLHPKPIASWQAFLDSSEKIAITVAPFDRGLFCLDPKVIIITEAQLFEERVFQRRRRKPFAPNGESIIRNLTELHIGDPVVHIEHGVGRFLGLQTITVNDQIDEYLTLQYADNDKLYVPISSLNLISRYSGGDIEGAPLHRLGSNQWEKVKRKAAERIHDVAAELLDIYARRAMKTRQPFNKPDKDYLAFVHSFPFEETHDQTKAIEEVISDMLSDKPMDRLICGDVGFGKTEVAIRAAFLAIQSRKQVAMLVPTTLLAQQHYQSFKDRFVDFPIKTEMLSRFCTLKQQRQILKSLKEGKTDIVIGTHKLLQPDIQFNDLGLVIIDEEHRFGVRQKERLKSLRCEVDILTLTATPIPRTLNMSFSGIRDLSIIATPPARRLSIKTFIHEYDSLLIREAILREIARGGQVYYLYNKVEKIDRIAEDLRQQIPEARIKVAHGQMRKRELENIMVDFYRRRFNVLVCTTIIESGIDIPSANTLIVHRADMFGLAQLHQLRGRVGRSHRQAYAYLFIPSKTSMTKDAEKRLEAVIESGTLGAGFIIATHDMEIRGAGELLGEEQSGHIQAVGFSLYMEMLEQTVEALKSGKEPDLGKPYRQGVEINLQLCALIPGDYLPDTQMRLVLYKRIANAPDDEALDELRVEMIDRFGLLPPATQNLFKTTSLKILAEPLGIEKIEANPKYGKIIFKEKPNINPNKIIQLIQSKPKQYKLAGSNSLKFVVENKEQGDRIMFVKKILEDLQE